MYTEVAMSMMMNRKHSTRVVVDVAANITQWGYDSTKQRDQQKCAENGINN